MIGVALRVGDDVAQRVARVRRGAEGRLLPWAEELCASAGLALSAVDGVAVSVGPGAFTGVRVGIATAMGLCLALDIPAVPVLSLESRARRVTGAGPVLVMLDARKSRVYAGLHDGQGWRVPPADVPPGEALAWPGATIATGEGAVVYGEQVRQVGLAVSPDAEHPAVDTLAWLGQRAVAAGEGRGVGTIEPVYIREPDARPPAPPTR